MTRRPLAHVTLSDRDRLILTAYANGDSDRKIGRAIGMHPDSVYSIGRRLRRRIGAVNRANAVAVAYENGWLPMPPAVTS